MDIAYTPEQQALQQRTAEYMQSIASEDLFEEMKDPNGTDLASSALI